MEYLKQLSSPKWTDSKNQLKIDGFDFIEFTTKFPLEIIDIFTSFGFVLTSRHHSKNIFLLEQGEVKFIVNAEVGTDAASFESIHGSGVCGMGFRVEDSNFALQAALEKGAEAVICSDYGLPAIRGIGGSKIYLIDRQTSEHFLASFFQTKVEIAPANPQITCVDHITHNVFRGNMEAWAKFYERIFNFQEIRYFNIKGKKTGLRSKALISPCGKIRIPLNESQDDHSQIAEFLKKYNGEGIQHIALGCDDICSVVNQIKQQGVVFQDTPDTYYDLIAKRIPNHEENATALKKLRILIDGNKQEDGILLQIFTKETIGPIFFEFIERKGNEGFGEGNFQALFESIELDQIRRGVLSVAESFKPLSSEELENYVNPSLAKVAFGGEETGIRTIELGREHSLFKFLEQFSQTERSAVALSLFSILLHKYTGQEQFKLRQYQIAEESYQLDLASNLTEKSCFNELLTSAQKLNDDKFNHQHNLVDDTQNNDVNYSLAYFAPGISQEKIDTLTQNHLAQSEMCLLLDSDSHAYLAYNQALFDDNFLTNLIRHFDILIQNIQSDYQGNLEFLSLTSQTDLTLQCDRGQTPNSDYGHLPIYRHFEQYAQKFPESIAITFGQQQVSYSALNCQANQLAHYLINQNIKPQDCVGVFVEPGVEILIAILAIHKINAVYVPIDTEYPLGRIKTIIEQVSPGVIIGASERLSEIEQNFEIDTINLAALNLNTFAQSNLNYSCPAESISHIFFTSGTTGTPKGVVFSHRNLIHYIFAAQEKYHFSAADSFLSATRYTFSISLLMLLLPLVRGGKVNIITFEQLLEPKLLAKAIEKSSFFHLGPSILKMLLDFLEQDNYNSDRFSQVKHASSGGDMITADILNRLNRVFTQAEVYAIYGSSEISCMGCTYFVPKEQEIKQTLVGKPFNNVGLRVLDQHQRVIPLGVKGEIYFSGAGISQGYLNLPHRTKTSYVWLDGERFYRTGDIGRLTPQGNLQILGRDDNQVQIRGMRIELGEIESSLNLHPAISACMVIVKQDRLGEKQIIAYLISQKESPASSELRSFLQPTLPQYMIPAHFVSVAQFPLNPNGKVDRLALSEMELKLDSQSLTQPSTATEKQLVKIWQEVLKLETIGIENNFFDLGGHSLLATQIISRVREILEVEVSIGSLFAHPTIAVLAKQIDATSSKNPVTPILPAPRQEKIPLSLTQQRLWFLDQLEPESSAYNIPLALEVKGVLSINTLERAIAEIVRRHETLRTNFETVEDTPAQIIHANREIPLKVVDLRSLSESERNTQLQRLMETEINRSFDLSQQALLRTTLFELTPETQVLLVIMHHIVSDAWSLEIFTRELSAIYTGIVNGQSSPLSELSIQYADFTHWQREYLQGEIYQTQLNYWQQQLAGLPPLLELPLDKPRPAIQTFDGGIERINLSPELTAKLQTISKECGATLFMTLLAAFATLLSRYSNSQDIAIGSPIANRNRSELESLIGFFINTLVLRTNLEGEPSFEELLQRVRQTTLDAYTHQNLPFEKLVEELNPERSLSYNPLFQVFFNMLNVEETQLELPGLKTESISIVQNLTSKFDLTLYAEEKKEGIQLQLVYKTELFTSERMVLLLDQFHHLLSQIVATPDQPISSYSLVTPSSISLLPDPSEVLPEPEYELVTTTFSFWANRTREQAAICQGNSTWNYGDLYQTAQTLAKVLLAHEIEKGDVVAVSGTRSFGFIASMLGVFFSGGVLLNIDPKLPQHRQQIMLQEAQAKYILYVGSQPSDEKFPDDKGIWDSLVNIYVEPKTGEAINPQKDSSLITHLPEIAADDAAYIFFTSGTTGVPKGVLGCHKGLSHFLAWQRQTFAISPQDRIGQLIAPSFDVVLRDIFLPLTSGATLCLPQEENILEPTQILSWLEREQISAFHTVPGLAQSWLTNVPAGVFLCNLRWLFFAGEPLKGTLIQQWREAFPQAGEIVNLYGPTETTLAKCCYRVPNKISSGVQLVGFPLPETQALVLGINNQLCGIGEKGEIVIRTPFRTLGYINSSNENLSRFVKNPFGHDQQDLLYYTGDLGRYHPDGSLEILGRLDHQVKIRGVRIEPKEIEAVLSQHPDLLQNIVIVREDVPGDKKLVAYVVASTETTPTNGEIRQFLRQQLPEYMIPSVFVFLDTIPLTPNGKVNRRALPVPDNTRQESSSTFVAPQDQLESHLTEIWSQVLGIQPIGVRDNFFDLGGNSLKAVTLFAQIEKQFGKKLPIATLFQSGTVAEIAQIIRSKEWLAFWSSLVPIQPTGSKPPLFYIHPGGGNLLVYRDLAIALGSDQPVYGLQPRGLDGKYAPFNRIEDMAAHYFAQIRKLQPHGPYFLAGLSSGGATAWEIAQLLQAQGQKVALLALFDSSGPDYYQILPPLPRLLSVCKWVMFNFLSKLSLLPKKIVHKLRELGAKQTSTKILESLRVVKKTLNEDQNINNEKMQKIFQVNLAKYKSLSHNKGLLEKWVNSIAIFLLKYFARGLYPNVFVRALSGDDINNIDTINEISKLPEALKQVQQANIIANRNYIPLVYSGRVILFRASNRPPGFYFDPKLGWGDLPAGGMEIYEIPGDHNSIMKSPILAEQLRICLEKAQADT